MKFWIRILRILGAVSIFVLVWYIFSRASHKFYPVRLYSNNTGNFIAPANNGKALKIGSYNIAHGRGGKFGASNWQKRSKLEMYQHLDGLAKQINEANLDVIVLNEVDFRSAWSNNINQAEYLMKKCNFGYRLEQTNMHFSIPFFYFHFGNAVLSKNPIEDEEFIDFPALSKKEVIFAGDHDGAFCKIGTPAGKIGLFVVHLEYRNEDIRVTDSKIIGDMASKLDIPVLAVGDFNSSPPNTPKSRKSKNGENAIEYLIGKMGFLPYLNEPIFPQNYTFPSEKPDRIIDWIIGQNIKGFNNSTTIPSQLSDHLMIVGEVNLKVE